MSWIVWEQYKLKPKLRFNLLVLPTNQVSCRFSLQTEWQTEELAQLFFQLILETVSSCFHPWSPAGLECQEFPRKRRGWFTGKSQPKEPPRPVAHVWFVEVDDVWWWPKATKLVTHTHKHKQTNKQTDKQTNKQTKTKQNNNNNNNNNKTRQ